MLASDSRPTPDTVQRVADSSRRPVQAPTPLAAHQRRLSAGAETRPTTGSSPSMRAMSVAQTGTPRTKFFVPSIGSSTHLREPCPVVPNSSPITASRVRARLSVIRSISSTARSASVTGVRSGLVSTFRSWARNQSRLIESAWSASTWASRMSSLKPRADVMDTEPSAGTAGYGSGGGRGYRREVDATTIVGLLADPARLKVVAALALGAGTIEEVAAASGLPLKDVALAARRLARAGLVERDGHDLALHTDRFGAAARAAAEAAPRPE